MEARSGNGKWSHKSLEVFFFAIDTVAAVLVSILQLVHVKKNPDRTHCSRLALRLLVVELRYCNAIRSLTFVISLISYRSTYFDI
jgi:hypothetical protein